MFKFKLFLTSLISLLTIGAFSISPLISAQEAPVFYNQNIMTALNHTLGVGEGDPINAEPGNVIEFRVVALNTIPNTTATNVKVTGNLPATPAQTLTATSTVSADNAGSVSDTVTVNIISGGEQGFEYIPGHARIFSPSCPSGCDASDTVLTSGISIGNLAFNESAQVFFKAFITNVVVVTPTPTATITPTPTPTPTTTITPTPTPTTSQQGNTNTNTNTNSQTQSQTQANTQTQTATTGSSSSSSSSSSNVTVNNPTPQVVTVTQPAVAGVSTTKELPKTGLPLLAWAAAAFLPAGFKLRKFSKSSEGFESANFIWEEREYKRS